MKTHVSPTIINEAEKLAKSGLFALTKAYTNLPSVFIILLFLLIISDFSVIYDIAYRCYLNVVIDHASPDCLYLVMMCICLDELKLVENS